MRALIVERKPLRFAAARLASEVEPGRGARVGPLRLKEIDEPVLPGPDWLRVRPRLSGICGSDLATVDGRSSRWFESVVSFPFTPGHEMVGDTDDGRRVVVEPVLGCTARGVEPRCPACAVGAHDRCERLHVGGLAPGLQSGFCCSTGGGWGQALMAHASQVHDVPDALSDEAAVMVEPAACALHAALSTRTDGGIVAVLGAGTLGLCTTAAVSAHGAPSRLLVGAKHPEQRRLARALGATDVVSGRELARAVRRATGSFAYDNGTLAGGADVTYDCVGSSDSIGTSIAMTRPGGTVVLVGMPATVTVDLTSLWQQQIRLQGAYAYGVEPKLGLASAAGGLGPASAAGGLGLASAAGGLGLASAAGGLGPASAAGWLGPASAAGGLGPASAAGGLVRTFAAAMELVARYDLGRLVSARYPLGGYVEAIDHAAHAGVRGAVKIVFAPQERQR